MGKNETETAPMELRQSDAFAPYQHSFGGLQNKTVVSDPMNGFDMRTELKSFFNKGLNKPEMKAHDTTAGGTGTAGYGMVPIYVDPTIIDRSRKYTPWIELCPRVTNQGTTADYNVIKSKGSAVTKNEDAALSEASDEEDRASTSIKYIYAVGRVTGQMQAAQPAYMVQGMQTTGSGLPGTTYTTPSAPNAKQYEVLKKAKSFKEKEEDLFWNGNSSSDSTEFDGIIQIQSSNNQNDLSGANLEWDDLEDTVEYAYTDSGRPNAAGCSSQVFTDIRSILVDTFRLTPADMGTEVAAGITARLTLETMVGPVPVIPSQNLSNTAAQKQLWFLDMGVVEMRVLQEMTYEDLAKTNDSQKFMIKGYEALVNKAPQFSSFIDNIA